ncbi:hypothetical protein M2158_006263 [Streptomyces sp. SAI-144]|nr:hypothetical protein [Streptomyces sp. SAI-144]MDH6485141.1 hypothetical protein [Streptomyces sp. SAI-127]
MPGRRSITQAEKLAAEKLGGFPIRRDQMAAVANIYRARPRCASTWRTPCCEAPT